MNAYNTYQPLATINGFNDPRQSIVFSRDGKQAFVLNNDLSITVIDGANRVITNKLTASQ